ncbi:MAG: GNAT family N-acetyltransferase [Terriglobales bacterium]
MAAGKAERSSGLAPEVIIRPLETADEMEACVELQREAWGFSDLDLVPRRIFVVARKIGGQVLGAMNREGGSERLVGFTLALPGHRPGQTFWHSHMLAVAASLRNQGLGRRLKLKQREAALELGLELIEWTFDPLEIINGYFNLGVLGAIARRYHANLYGTSSSKLQAGLPTDRLTAEWWLRSPRVEAAARGEAQPEPVYATSVTVPSEVQIWKQQNDARALEAQVKVRKELSAAFASGHAALGYRLEPGGGTFLVGPGVPEVKA